MAEFLIDLIFDKRASRLEVLTDANLVKLQQKLLDVIEPISTVEKASNSCFEQLEVSLFKILTKLNQTAILLDQAFNHISHARRFNCTTTNYWRYQENETIP